MPTPIPSPQSQCGYPSLQNSRGWFGEWAAAWGVLGVLLILGFAVYRLLPIALEPLRMDLQPHHWLLYVGNIVFMAYSEGYRGFQRGFVPRVVGRAHLLRHKPTILQAVFAPFFCMGLFQASRKRMLTSWTVLLGIYLLVWLVRDLNQPWRGIIDAGVVVGLSWGIVVLLYTKMRNLLSA